MINELDYEQYRLALKDCTMISLSRMNQMIADELSSRYENTYPLLSQPNSEISKLKMFMDVVNQMLKYPKNKEKEVIAHDDLIDVLHGSGFSTDEAKTRIKKAMENGQIYERRAGYYAKA